MCVVKTEKQGAISKRWLLSSYEVVDCKKQKGHKAWLEWFLCITYYDSPKQRLTGLNKKLQKNKSKYTLIFGSWITKTSLLSICSWFALESILLSPESICSYLRANWF
jgi:hypothetical protein